MGHSRLGSRGRSTSEHVRMEFTNWDNFGKEIWTQSRNLRHFDFGLCLGSSIIWRQRATADVSVVQWLSHLPNTLKVSSFILDGNSFGTITCIHFARFTKRDKFLLDQLQIKYNLFCYKFYSYSKFLWCSGYHICLTGRRSSVRSWTETVLDQLLAYTIQDLQRETNFRWVSYKSNTIFLL